MVIIKIVFSSALTAPLLKWPLSFKHVWVSPRFPIARLFFSFFVLLKTYSDLQFWGAIVSEGEPFRSFMTGFSFSILLCLVFSVFIGATWLFTILIPWSSQSVFISLKLASEVLLHTLVSSCRHWLF